eukprot:CAMPEP_0206219170 /NCGR_PEP_ID=MMETSP0047_2-20121206/4181_1 /ASSEMBLY_ACC=CAM_ASM_000192 /TAXON_ID=195065 /ORGANISM="Chroomonas mesostigmatica_cf, Strain CCMP1168" /LENGTH=56 /DNA_ID=CAMNT_0053641705 /DNA_START=157 /DNA_END=324 /DNA_ORIENTATION=-
MEAVVRERDAASDAWHGAVLPLLTDAPGAGALKDEEAAFETFLRAVSFGSCEASAW